MKKNAVILKQNYTHFSQCNDNKSSLFFNPVIQPKLTINNPDDKYEKEADAMADKVMRMEQPGVQLKPLPITLVQRKCEHCEAEEKVQRKEINSEEKTADSNLQNYVGNLNSGGQTLSTEARNFYEPRFGYDFSNVKVHTDTVAAKSAQSINALAYTSGSNIVFNSGQFSPNTESGKKLLGHELTHVVQQNAALQNQISIQREEAPEVTDLPGDEPQLPRNEFVTSDSLGITNNKDSKISLDIHIDYLPSHTRLHVFIATEQGGDYRQGQPLEIIGDPNKGGDYSVTLSPVPSHFYIRLEARSEKTGINVPNVRGTCVMSLD